MTTPTEQQLRELFATDAAAAPHGTDLVGGTLRKVQHRRRVRTAGATGLIAAVVVAGGVAAGWSPAGPAAPPEAAPTDVPTGVGALPGSGIGDCVQEYSPSLVAGQDFAFEGTVTAIDPARIDPVPGPKSPLVQNWLAEVTFQVDTWFLGGSGETVSVHLDKPNLGMEDSAVSAYGIGTRLLVSGVTSSIEGAGLIGQSCGFTRYYDEQTAAEWAAATD